MKSFKIVVMLCLLSLQLAAQKYMEVSKDDFFVKEAGFKDAWGNLKEGMFMLEENTREAGELAVESLLKAAAYNPECAPLNYDIALAYRLLRNNAKELEYLKMVYKSKPSLTPNLGRELADCVHLNGNFAEALLLYETYLKSLPADKIPQEKPIVEKKILECKTGISLTKSYQRALIYNLGDNVNSAYNDHSPLVVADNSTLYFTSRRPIKANDKRDKDGGYFEDIYQSEFVNGAWQKVGPVAGTLNTDDHDATIGLSADGQTMFVYRAKNKGDIYESHLEGKNWGKATPLRGDVNSSSRESSACLSYDGKELFFVSDRPGGYGGSDLYVATLDAKGKWTNIQNLGAVLNTAFNEEQVFMMPDGQTLYFSSQGHSTMGGYDIFRTIRDAAGNWSEPENLGWPINTSGDDIFYTATQGGKVAYYASEAVGSYGGADICKIEYLSAENPLVMQTQENYLSSLDAPVVEKPEIETIELKTIRLTILKGLVLDSVTRQPLEANIEIVDNEKNELVFSSKSNSSTGKYLVSLPSGRNYGIAVSLDGYMFHTENFNIPAAQNYTEVDKNIGLLNIKTGSKVVLKNIFFEFGSARLASTSQAEIIRVVQFLNRYPKVRIRISGHTDNVGGDAANLTLSLQRAQAVVAALVAAGVPSTSLEAKGAGKTQPVMPNDTEAGRQMNRRVEFEVID
ncbi:MAG: hypothetical protein RIS47_255 [Bacteroidota bacterium]